MKVHFFVLILYIGVATAHLASSDFQCVSPPPPPGQTTSAKGIPACGKHECDDPDVRDLYYVGPNTPVVRLRLYVVFCSSDLSADILTNFNTQIELLRQQYMTFFKVEWDITVNVTDKYTSLVSNAYDTNAQVAKELSVPGSMTLIFSTFSDNTLTGGYYYLPQNINFDTSPEYYYGLINIYGGGLDPGSSTMLHELGHAFGLPHAFIDSCTCSEALDSPDLNLVGDFCNDTLPVPSTFSCTELNGGTTTDCNGASFSQIDLSTRPLNNYMTNTPASCKTTFTPQQAARARCYIDKILWRFTAPAPPVTEEPPSSTPETTATPNDNVAPSSTAAPSSSATPARAPGNVSSGSRGEDLFMYLAALTLLVTF